MCATALAKLIVWKKLRNFHSLAMLFASCASVHSGFSCFINACASARDSGCAPPSQGTHFLAVSSFMSTPVFFGRKRSRPFRRSAGRRRDFCRLPRVGLGDIILDQRLELFGDALAFQGRSLLAVDVDRGDRPFAGAGQADADVGVLALAGA